MPHIIEAEDSIVGPHFVFLAHRDQDHDRGKGVTDRRISFKSKLGTSKVEV